MQSGREDTLEERYAIKFCFKLGKTATETYGMLQTAYGPSCMNRSSVFQWHKKFKEGRESVRDDERCGRSREVRTSEMIGQINDFMNRDRRVSIETLSAQFNVSVGAVHIIIREELKMRKICAKFVLRVLREDQRERRCNDSKEMVELINSDLQVLDALVTCDESWIYCYDPETKRQSFVSFCFICHFYPPFTRKRIVSLYFGREVRTRLGVAFFEVYGPPVFHIKAGASR